MSLETLKSLEPWAIHSSSSTDRLLTTVCNFARWPNSNACYFTVDLLQSSLLGYCGYLWICILHNILFIFFVILHCVCQISLSKASMKQYKTSVEFILTNLFGYLIRTGCTGTPGTKAPMEVKRVANKHFSFILCSFSYIHTS